MDDFSNRNIKSIVDCKLWSCWQLKYSSIQVALCFRIKVACVDLHVCFKVCYTKEHLLPCKRLKYLQYMLTAKQDEYIFKVEYTTSSE